MYYQVGPQGESGIHFHSDNAFPKLLYRDLPVSDFAIGADKAEHYAEMDRIGMNKVQGRSVETIMVGSIDEELLAVDAGWRATVAPVGEEAPVRRGPGRPARVAVPAEA